MTQITTNAQIAQNNMGQYYALAAGILVLASSNWTGYYFNTTDDEGNPIDGAIAYRAIFPDSVSVVGRPYLIPPNYPQPGNLLSYVLSL